MRIRALALALTLFLTLCQLAPYARAYNDDDWTPTDYAQWWWKYVRSSDRSLRTIEVAGINIVPVRSDRAGYFAYQVTFTLANRSSIDYRGGNTFAMGYEFSEPDPHPWRPTIIARGVLPALGAGQILLISGIAYSPEEGNYNNFVALTVH